MDTQMKSSNTAIIFDPLFQVCPVIPEAMQTTPILRPFLGQSFQAALTLLERSLLLESVNIDTDIDDSVKIMAQTNEIQQIFVVSSRMSFEAIKDRYGQSPEGRIAVKISRERHRFVCNRGQWNWNIRGQH